MPSVRPLYKDAFNPTLLESEVLKVSDEQKGYIKDILDKACSDSRFSQKAYASIVIVLTQGSVKVPVINSINPTSAKLGSDSFDIHVLGKEFNEGSTIVWNGSEEPTTRVSDTELTTGVNMGTAEVAMDIPIQVRSGDGVLSNSIMFSLLPADAPLVREIKQDQISPIHKLPAGR